MVLCRMKMELYTGTNPQGVVMKSPVSIEGVEEMKTEMIMGLTLLEEFLVDPHGFEGYLKMVVEVPDSS
ncbi:hypothetical protein Tco_0528919 [Tanacetum coccineum]